MFDIFNTEERRLFRWVAISSAAHKKDTQKHTHMHFSWSSFHFSPNLVSRASFLFQCFLVVFEYACISYQDIKGNAPDYYLF